MAEVLAGEKDRGLRNLMDHASDFVARDVGETLFKLRPRRHSLSSKAALRTVHRRRPARVKGSRGHGVRVNFAEPIDCADLAGGAGYFDQAHFGHEFRAFTGLTPTQ